jgi:hypothetical protein
MNLRESQLSSRSWIPVALALPINQGPTLQRERADRERDLRARLERGLGPTPSRGPTSGSRLGSSRFE